MLLAKQSSSHELSRHDLVWLTAAGWQQAMKAAGVDGAAVALFRDHDWPAVVRRREPAAAADQVSIGLPLPPTPDGAKRRCAIDIPHAAIARSRAPLALAGVADQLPARWVDAGAALLADIARLGVALGVFGSLAMQALTGRPYLTAASDLDLLLRPATLAELHVGLALLLRHCHALPLDGEIVFPGGAAVSWKEWGAAGAVDQRVLVKHVDFVRLAPKADLLLTLASA